MSVGRKFRGLIGAGLSVFSAVCASQVSRAEDLKFDTSTGTLYVSGSEVINYKFIDIWKQSNDRSLVRSIIIGDGVKEIGEYSFCGFKNLASIELSDSVTKIGELAFYDCRSLSEIDLKNVKKIGDGAFSGCIQLRQVEMFNVEKIGNSAFVCCGFINLTLPNSITEIGTRAFLKCKSLYSVTLPDNIKVIDYCTFAMCNKLTTVICGKKEGEIIIKENAFLACTNLSSFVNNKYVAKCDPGAFRQTQLKHLGGRTILSK